jgi:hypothetical protein
MPRKPQSRGTCHYCGDEITRRSVAKHLAQCTQRAGMIRFAEAGKQPVETLWYLQIQDAHNKEFWLHLEMRGSATLEKLDAYLRAIWLECCGHMSKFTIGGWGSLDVGKSRKADDVFAKEAALLHLYDFGTTSETEIHAAGSRTGRAPDRYAIAQMARNKMPEMRCRDCGSPATHLCIECLYEATKEGAWFLCEKHVKTHPHDEYGEPVALVNSPRVGMCGYEGPANPPY